MSDLGKDAATIVDILGGPAQRCLDLFGHEALTLALVNMAAVLSVQNDVPLETLLSHTREAYELDQAISEDINSSGGSS